MIGKDPAWYKPFWRSRKWMVGVFVFAIPLYALRWFEHLDNTAFTACFSVVVGALFAASEYSKRTAIAKDESERCERAAQPGEEP